MPPISEGDLDRFAEYLPEVDDPVLIVLKMHLLVEDLLVRLVEDTLPQPDHFHSSNIRSFYDLQWLARACLPENLDREDTWHAIRKLNSVRNEFVHNHLDEKEIEAGITDMLQSWPPDADPTTEIPSASDQTTRLRLCFGHLYGTVLDTVSVVEEADRVPQEGSSPP